jgi:hypothetical protein
VCAEAKDVGAVCMCAGMVPMLLVGRLGTPVPHPSRMTVVFGKPIEVPHIDDPADDVVRRV